MDQLIQILANLGVIAGIVFLVIEIRQNNELMEAQTRFNRLAILTGTETLIAENAQLAGIIAKSEAGSALTPLERVQFDALYGRTFSNLHWSYQEVPLSDLPLSTVRGVFSRPGARAIWERRKEDFHPDFVRFIEEEILSVEGDQ